MKQTWSTYLHNTFSITAKIEITEHKVWRHSIDDIFVKAENATTHILIIRFDSVKLTRYRSKVWTRARRLLLQYIDGCSSAAAKLDASWNKWMLTMSTIVPFTSHLVRRNPFRDHLHCKKEKQIEFFSARSDEFDAVLTSGKKCCGNFAFSLVATASMFPVCMLLPSTASHSCVRKFHILMLAIDFSIKYKLPNACEMQ